MTPELLTIECSDQTGLVHAITGVLLKHGLNVVSNHEFVDIPTQRFFMRTGFTGNHEPATLMADLMELLPPDARLEMPSREPSSLVILASREHHCLADLLIRQTFSQLPVRLLAVISNHSSLGPLVEKFEIPFHHISADGISREEHEKRVLDCLSSYHPSYLALAKYMRILSPEFVGRWPGRIINIHHSFLPAFAGAKPYHQAYARGVKVIGATAHFVTDVLDEGPIIAQQVISADHRQSPQALALAGKEVEQSTLARALRLVLEHRVFLCQNRTVIFD